MLHAYSSVRCLLSCCYPVIVIAVAVISAAAFLVKLLLFILCALRYAE